MTWEWEYHSNPQRWTLIVGDWSAVVQVIDRHSGRWLPSIERTVAPLERQEGRSTTDPMAGRAWCLSKIAELRAKG